MKTCLLLLLLLPCALWAQPGIWRGRVVDAQTGEGLSFALLKTLPAGEGTYADVDGYFVLAPQQPVKALVVSLVGYEADTLTTSGPEELTIALRANPLELETVVVKAGENPALTLIRQAIAHRKEHHPRLYPAFNYQSYTKINMRPSPGMRLNAKSDSLMQQMDLMVWETTTQRQYRYPNRDYERIEGSRVSGLKGVALPLSPTDIQDISFYTDWVTIIEQPFLSPLAYTAPSRYWYELADVVYQYPDSVYIIRYGPRTSFAHALQGELRISSDGYALAAITAEATVAEDVPTLIGFRLQQLHARVDSLWFPSQLYTEVDFATNKLDHKKGIFLSLKARTYLDSVNFDATGEMPIGEVKLEVAEGAAQQSDTYWLQRRHDPLTAKDSATYLKMDSLGGKTPLGWMIRQINEVRLGYLAFGPLSVELNRLYTLNRVEGSRYGLGLRNNERLSPNYTLAGWAGYGVSDHQWKYGGSLQLHPFVDPRLRLCYSYDYDLLVTGGDYLGLRQRLLLHERPQPYRNSRMLFMEVMDYIERHRLSLFLPGPKNTQYHFALQHERIQPAYGYSYRGSSSFETAEMIGELRWSPGERFRKEERKLISLGSDLPQLLLRLVLAPSGIPATSLYYQKYEATLQQVVPVNGWLRLQYQLNGGWYAGSLPYPKLYVFHANGEPNFIAEGYAFNTMFFNDFAATRFATGHLYFHLVNRRFPGRRYHPDARIGYNFGWGDLQGLHQTDHEGMALRAPTLGYHEAGIALINLLPRPLLKMAPTLQFLGLGLYWRMGPYAVGTFPRNVAPKMEYRIKF